MNRTQSLIDPPPSVAAKSLSAATAIGSEKSEELRPTSHPLRQKLHQDVRGLHSFVWPLACTAGKHLETPACKATLRIVSDVRKPHHLL